jgi:hypothetical protein
MTKAWGAALLCVMAGAQAGEPGMGAWFGMSNQNQVAAGLASESGQLLGMTCTKTDNTCIWNLAVDVRCNLGANVAVLVSSTVGAAHITGKCLGVGNDKDLWRLELEPYDTVAKAIMAGGTLGVVVPMDDGKFKVFRFTTDGADKAISALAAAYKALSGARSKDGEF